jgi:hypothetical protein
MGKGDPSSWLYIGEVVEEAYKTAKEFDYDQESREAVIDVLGEEFAAVTPRLQEEGDIEWDRSAARSRLTPQGLRKGESSP